MIYGLLRVFPHALCLGIEVSNKPTFSGQAGLSERPVCRYRDGNDDWDCSVPTLKTVCEVSTPCQVR